MIMSFFENKRRSKAAVNIILAFFACTVVMLRLIDGLIGPSIALPAIFLGMMYCAYQTLEYWAATPSGK